MEKKIMCVRQPIYYLLDTPGPQIKRGGDIYGTVLWSQFCPKIRTNFIQAKSQALSQDSILSIWAETTFA